jgi:hypothetical protein
MCEAEIKYRPWIRGAGCALLTRVGKQYEQGCRKKKTEVEQSVI